MGNSAGGIGTEANCDLFADTLHSFNQEIKVKCVVDSGTLYPLQTHTPGCNPHVLLYTAFTGNILAWDDHDLYQNFVKLGVEFLMSPVLLQILMDTTVLG